MKSISPSTHESGTCFLLCFCLCWFKRNLSVCGSKKKHHTGIANKDPQKNNQQKIMGKKYNLQGTILNEMSLPFPRTQPFSNHQLPAVAYCWWSLDLDFEVLGSAARFHLLTCPPGIRPKASPPGTFDGKWGNFPADFRWLYFQKDSRSLYNGFRDVPEKARSIFMRIMIHDAILQDKRLSWKISSSKSWMLKRWSLHTRNPDSVWFFQILIIPRDTKIVTTQKHFTSWRLQTCSTHLSEDSWGF